MKLEIEREIKKEEKLDVGDVVVVNFDVDNSTESYLVILNNNDNTYMLKNFNGGTYFSKPTNTLQELLSDLNNRDFEIFKKDKFKLVLKEI